MSYADTLTYQTWSNHPDTPQANLAPPFQSMSLEHFPYQVIFQKNGITYLFLTTYPWFYDSTGLGVTIEPYPYVQYVLDGGQWSFVHLIDTNGGYRAFPILDFLESNHNIYTSSSKTGVYFSQTTPISIPSDLLFDWSEFDEGGTNEFEISILNPYPQSPTVQHYSEVYISISKNSLLKLGAPPLPDRVIVNGRQFMTNVLTTQTIESSYWSGTATYKILVPLTIGPNTVDIIWDIKQTHIAAHFKEGVRLHIYRYEPPSDKSPGDIDDRTGETWYPITDPNNPYYDIDRDFNNNIGSSTGIMNSISNIFNSFQSFFSFLGTLFTWLPPEITALIVFAISLAIALRVLGR